MPDYIQYDSRGIIIATYPSADPSIVAGKPNILEVGRNTFRALTKYYVVDSGILRQMTIVEKDAYDAALVQVESDAEKKRILEIDSRINEINEITLTKIDNAIDSIGNLADAKNFLKKLCRFIVRHISD